MQNGKIRNERKDGGKGQLDQDKIIRETKLLEMILLMDNSPWRKLFKKF